MEKPNSEVCLRRNNILQFVTLHQPSLTMAYPGSPYGKSTIVDYHFDPKRIRFYDRRSETYKYVGETHVCAENWESLWNITLDEAVQYICENGEIITHQQWFQNSVHLVDESEPLEVHFRGVA